MENLEQSQPTQPQPAVEELTSPSTQPLALESKPKSPYLLPIFLSLFTLLLGGGLVFAYFTFLKPGKVVPRPVASPISSPSPSPDETKEWKSYRNETYGYDIKYPSDWSIRIISDNRDNPEALIQHGVEFTGPDSILVWVEVWKNPSHFSLMEWFDKVPTDHPDYKPGTFRGAPLPQEPNFVVAGEPAVQVPEKNDPQAPPYLSTFFGKEDKIYRIGYIADGRLPEEIYNLMLQTFKFTDNETTDWETYRNEEYGFEIKYPNDWKLGESFSNGYPYINWLDPIAQQITLPQTEIDQGAIVQIYMKDTSKYAVQPVTPSALKDILLGMDLTKGLYSDPEATQQVNEETLEDLNGVRQSIYSKYYRTETFVFIKDYHTETVVFEVSITVYKPLENPQKTNEYIATFNFILQTFKFTE